MAKTPRKREKKYKPKSVHVKHELSMSWDVMEAHRLSNMHKIMNDIPDGERFSTNMLQNIYKGELIVAIAENLISRKQLFNAEIISYVLDELTGEKIKHVFKTCFEKPIEYIDFLTGSKSHRINRGNGIKTRWKGINEEWHSDLTKHFPSDDYDLLGAQARMWCNAVKIKADDLQNTKKIKLIHQMRKMPLGVKA